MTENPVGSQSVGEVFLETYPQQHEKIHSFALHNNLWLGWLVDWSSCQFYDRLPN
jgi:hypothetical protein